MQFFATPALWREWLQQHHDTATELVVGFWKTGSGTPSMTWSESVDEALSFGWIDAIRRRVDDDSYTIRFTRRKPASIWSSVNVAKIQALEAAGKMTDAGRAAFALRRDDRTGTYAHEQGDIMLDETALLANAKAWAFWQAQPPSYKKVARHWVTSAKQEQTRERRMGQLVSDCAEGLRIRSQRR